MIQQLIQAIVARVQTGLTDVKVQALPPDLTPPATLPLIAVYPGPFAVSQAGREARAPARAQAAQQTITAKAGADRAGPYPLDAPALDQSLSAALLPASGPPQPLSAGQDFTVDYAQASVSFPGSTVQPGNQVALSYMTAQTTITREFQQELRVDVYAAELAAAAQWASLACAIILSGAEELLQASSGPDRPATYRAGLFATTHALSQLQLLAGTPGPVGNAWRYQLTFTTAGQLRMSQQLRESAGVITEVVIQ